MGEVIEMNNDAANLVNEVMEAIDNQEEVIEEAEVEEVQEAQEEVEQKPKKRGRKSGAKADKNDEEKPKRRRRTKAEMEAERAAKAEKKIVRGEAKAEVKDEISEVTNADPIDVGVLNGKLDEIIASHNGELSALVCAKLYMGCAKYFADKASSALGLVTVNEIEKPSDIARIKNIIAYIDGIDDIR